MNKNRYKKEIYPNGQIKAEGYINEEGRKIGNWKFFHENGHMKREGNYEEGKQDGYWKFYYYNGHLESEGMLEEGKPEGNWNFYSRNGHLEDIAKF